MTESRDPSATIKPTSGHVGEPELNPEVIKDLDPPTEATDHIIGGRCKAGGGIVQTQTL